MPAWASGLNSPPVVTWRYSGAYIRQSGEKRDACSCATATTAGSAVAVAFTVPALTTVG